MMYMAIFCIIIHLTGNYSFIFFFLYRLFQQTIVQLQRIRVNYKGAIMVWRFNGFSLFCGGLR